nr:hypothetical protein [uncultured Mediterranean phage uvMED]
MKSEFVRSVMKKYKVTQKDLALEWAKLDGKPKFQEVVSRALGRDKIDSIVFAQALANLVLRPVGSIVNESLLEETPLTETDFKQDLVIQPLDTYGKLDPSGVIMQTPAKQLNRNIEYFHWNNVMSNMRPTLNMGDSLIVRKIYDLDFKILSKEMAILCFDNFKQIHLGRVQNESENFLELFSDDIYSHRKSLKVEFKNIKIMYEVAGYVSHETENKSSYFLDRIENIENNIKALTETFKVNTL